MHFDTRIRLQAVLLCVLMLATALALGAGQAPAAPPPPAQHRLSAQPTPTASTPLVDTYSRPIGTHSELAQRYFDDGLRLTYSYNAVDARRAFEAALNSDPECAMCAWGIALAFGPTINAPMDDSAAIPAFAAIQLAQALKPYASVKERAFIDALATRYSETPVTDRSTYDLAYASAMRKLHRLYPEDADAATLFEQALMLLTPTDTGELQMTNVRLTVSM